MKKHNIKKKVAIIIQARTSSTRLPNKIIRNIDNDMTFLDVILSRIVSISNELPIILATSTNGKDKALGKYALKYNIPIFYGSEGNVLERFIKCAKQFNIKTVVRVCSDNPFIDLNLITNLIKNYKEEDYLSYLVNDKPSILTHSGFFSEMVSLKALEKVHQSNKANCHEHVTNCIYSSPEEFKVKFIKMDVPNSIRCTLDTEQDFENLKSIYLNWYKDRGNENFNYQDLVKFIKSKDKLLDMMRREIINNSK